MGYAKYTEDNILINYDRLYMKYGSDLFWGIIRDENFVKCPFCREKIRKNEMMNHINQIHENSVLLKYNALIAKENKYEEVNELNKLELFCNPKTIKSILITIEPSNRNIKINTVENEYEYDLMDYIEDFYFNEIKIIVKESEWKLRVNNEIDYSDLNINTIQMKKYRLDFFFEDLSSRYYEEDEAFSLLKLSIFENKMVDEVYEVLSSETMSSLFYQYYNLYKNDSNLIQPEKNNLSQSEWIALRYILDLRVDKAEEVLDKKVEQIIK